LEQKISVLEDALKQNVMLLNASENARKTAESKSKQFDEQVSKHTYLPVFGEEN